MNFVEVLCPGKQFAQNDPWAERAQGKDAHEFAPVANLKLQAAE